jgi:integrase
MPSAFSSRFKYVAAKLGYHGRVHDLRHACASMHLRAGTPLKLVSEMLGHSSISITADLYSHVSAGMQEAAAERLEGLRTVAQDAITEERATNGRQSALDGTGNVVPIVRQRR